MAARGHGPFNSGSAEVAASEKFGICLSSRVSSTVSFSPKVPGAIPECAQMDEPSGAVMAARPTPRTSQNAQACREDSEPTLQPQENAGLSRAAVLATTCGSSFGWLGR